MRCPFCGDLEDRVIDSRTIKNGDAIRRRRQCLKCDARFTSYETIEEIQTRVVKKDGRRELFDPAKIRNGILKACEKRPIPLDVIDQIIDRIEEKVARGSREVPTTEIGEAVIAELSSLDEVAYVRFASVYREFKDVNEFMSELKRLLSEQGKDAPLESHLAPGTTKKQKQP